MRVFLFAFLVMVVSALSAAAYVTGDIQDMTCINKTGFTFKFVNAGESEISTEDINVKVEIEGLAYLPPEEAQAPYTKGYNLPLAGKWSNTVIPGKNSFDTSYGVFESQQGLLFYPAQYRVTVGYQNCDPSLCKITTVKCHHANYCEISESVRCDGITKFGCDATELKVIHCHDMKDKLEVKFKGLDSGLMMDVNPYKDVDYTFHGSATHTQNDLPEGTKIEEVEKDVYVLSTPLYNNDKVDRVHIKDKLICDHEAYANCKSWYIGDEKNVTATSNTQEETYPSETSSKTAAVTSIVVYMVIILVIGIFILKKRKRRI